MSTWKFTLQCFSRANDYDEIYTCDKGMHLYCNWNDFRVEKTSESLNWLGRFEILLELFQLTTVALFCRIIYLDRTHFLVLENLANAYYFYAIFESDNLRRPHGYRICSHFLLQYGFLFMFCYLVRYLACFFSWRNISIIFNSSEWYFSSILKI